MFNVLTLGTEIYADAQYLSYSELYLISIEIIYLVNDFCFTQDPFRSPWKIPLIFMVSKDKLWNLFKKPKITYKYFVNDFIQLDSISI